jgi:hypothetical protein
MLPHDLYRELNHLMQCQDAITPQSFLRKTGSFGLRLARRTRNRLRSAATRRAVRLADFVYDRSLNALPSTRGPRLVEQRISLCRLPVSVRRWQREKYRVGLLVDEFFGGWDTAIGGYGALARNYICKYIPGDLIHIDVLLDDYGDKHVQQTTLDQTTLYRLPADPRLRRKWLARQAYDLFLSIEMTEPSFHILRDWDCDTPLLYWVQDPRDLRLYQPRLQSVNIIRDFDWSYLNDVAIWMQGEIARGRVTFISQGASLSQIARDLYRIPRSVPIKDLPNPVDLDLAYRLNEPPKENKIIFLARLEAQKRAWIFCEIARRMPQYQFYVLGATGKNRNESANAKTLEPYRNSDGSSKVPNLHFAGHVEGDAKVHHLKTAKLLVNTSIWEGIPVSWLEALSYGTLIVSAFDRDDIVSRFGTFVGEVFGDGADPDQLARFIAAIDDRMTHHDARNVLAAQAIQFVRGRHSVQAFVENIRSEIFRALR